ncbi:MAG: hypothetical protein KatS3mg011_0274 [Acidimicrobiia bacterium]|nr:MAG: hypothetical protein KatS3mg011_0274 [Acidimicrobiia bacterium]
MAALAACSGATRTVRGVVVEVDGDLTGVRSFTVITTDGERLHLTPDPDGRYAFPLPHLRDHLRHRSIRWWSPSDSTDGRALAIDDG